MRRVIRRAGRPVAAATAVAAALLAVALGGTTPTTDAPSGGVESAGGTAPLGGAAEPPEAPEQHGSDHSNNGPASGPEPDEDATVAAPVRVADADAARLLTPGDLVDVFATPLPESPDVGFGPTPGGGAEASEHDDQERAEGTEPTEAQAPQALRVAHRARVAEVPPPTAAEEIDPFNGALIVIEVSPTDAPVLAAADADSRLTVTRW